MSQMDTPAAPLPPPGNAPPPSTAPPEEWREALSTRLFQDESTIPAAASSDTANTAMVDVADVPLANSTNQVDHFMDNLWEKLIVDGTSPEVVAQIKADSDATVQLDTSQAMDTFVATVLPNQAIANSSFPAVPMLTNHGMDRSAQPQAGLNAALGDAFTASAICYPEFTGKSNKYHSVEPVTYGPAGTTDLAQIKRLKVTAKPYPASTASPTKDEYKAENAVLNEIVTEMKGKLETVVTKSKHWVDEQRDNLKTAAERLKQETQDAASMRIAKVQMSFQAQRQQDIQQQQLWQMCNAKDQKEAIAIWEKLGPEREAERKERGIWEIKPHEEKAYNKALAAAVIKYATPSAPAMATTPLMMTLQHVKIDAALLEGKSQCQKRKMMAKHNKEQRMIMEQQNKEQKLRDHTEKLSNSIGSEAYWAMIHQEISIKEAMESEQGTKAMLAEWAKLENPVGRPAAAKAFTRILSTTLTLIAFPSC